MSARGQGRVLTRTVANYCPKVDIRSYLNLNSVPGTNWYDPTTYHIDGASTANEPPEGYQSWLRRRWQSAGAF